MAKKANPVPFHTCADCFHFCACHQWAVSIPTDVAHQCPVFEPIKNGTLVELDDLRQMHKGDLAPVVYARWKTSSDDPDRLICSACGRRYDMYHFDQKDMPYCLCGAKMDEDE